MSAPWSRRSIAALASSALPKSGSPLFDDAVTRHDRGRPLVPLPDHLVEVERLVAGEATEPQVVDDQQIRRRVSQELPVELAVRSCRPQVHQQFVRRRVERAPSSRRGTRGVRGTGRCGSCRRPSAERAVKRAAQAEQPSHLPLLGVHSVQPCEFQQLVHVDPLSHRHPCYERARRRRPAIEPAPQ